MGARRYNLHAIHIAGWGRSSCAPGRPWNVNCLLKETNTWRSMSDAPRPATPLLGDPHTRDPVGQLGEGPLLVNLHHPPSANIGPTATILTTWSVSTIPGSNPLSATRPHCNQPQWVMIINSVRVAIPYQPPGPTATGQPQPDRHHNLADSNPLSATRPHCNSSSR